MKPTFTFVDFQVVLHWESSGFWEEDPVLRQPRPHHLLQVGSYHIIYIILLPILISPFPSDPKLPFLSSSSFWGSIQAKTWRTWQKLWALKQNRNTCPILRNKVLSFSFRNTCPTLINKVFSFSIYRERCSVHPWGSNFVTFHHIPFLTLYM